MSFFFLKRKKRKPFSSLTLGDLLCVYVLDLVRILGSTRGWFPCLSPPSFTVFPLLPFSDASFSFRLADLGGSGLSLAQGTQPFVASLASPEIVSSRQELGVLTNLRFRDPGHFKAGMIHERFPCLATSSGRLFLWGGSSRDSPGWCSCGEFFHPI